MLDERLGSALQGFLQGQHPAHDMEIRNGEIVIVSPSFSKKARPPASTSIPARNASKEMQHRSARQAS